MNPFTHSAAVPWCRRTAAALCWGFVLVLVACGGSPGTQDVAVTPDPVTSGDPIVVTVGPGEYKGIAPLGRFSLETIGSAVAAAAGTLPKVTPRYGVDTFRLEYVTLDGEGQPVHASALVSVPKKPLAARSPVLAYQHGTTTLNAEAPSNRATASSLPVVLASMGYIVLAPDYVGYGLSKGRPHPYLLSAPAASVVMDLLTAAKYWRQTHAVADNHQLFLTGYSEGAYVAMAAARTLGVGTSLHQRDLQAVVVGGGPYQVLVTLDALLNRVRAQNPVLGALINPGFLQYLGDGARASVRNELVKQLLGADSDVVIQSAVIDNYLADNRAAIELQSNVHDWKPGVPVKMFHGADDAVVNYRSATATLAAMQARGAGAHATLVDCAALPADHLGCVVPYAEYLLKELATMATDL